VFSFLAALTGTALSGCERDANEQTSESAHQPLYNGMTLGEGLDADPTPQGAPWPGTGSQCIGGNPKLEPLAVSSYVGAPDNLDEATHNQPFHRAFWVNSKDSAQTELQFAIEKQNGDGYSEYLLLEDVADQHYSQVFDKYDGAVLSLLVVIPTADLRLEGAGDVSEGCVESGQQPDNFGEWVETCGIRYLREEKYGHYFLFSVRADEASAITPETEALWNFLTLRYQIGAYDNQPVEEAMEQVANTYPDLRFFVTGWDEIQGAAPGRPDELFDEELFPPENLSEFVQ
jgi:hypothetical protein